MLTFSSTYSFNGVPRFFKSATESWPDSGRLFKRERLLEAFLTLKAGPNAEATANTNYMNIKKQSKL